LLLSVAASAILPAHVHAVSTPAPIRLGLMPVFLDDQVTFLEQWRHWLARKLERPVLFVQRGNYREMVDLLRSGKIDAAWLCGYPYVRYRHELQLLAVPLWRRLPLYQSYLIVPHDDLSTQRIGDLRGKVFAYSDPDSNSGFLYPRHLLKSRGENPASFFSRTFFTWAHRKIVEAVGVGLAHGGAVDGYVWETLAEVRPELTASTRIIERSPFMGHPPFVARRDLPREKLARIRQTLISMTEDDEGRALLKQLRLDGFVAGEYRLFESIDKMARELG
jgi:phosphonate transport system substrate-binding protein